MKVLDVSQGDALEVTAQTERASARQTQDRQTQGQYAQGRPIGPILAGLIVAVSMSSIDQTIVSLSSQAIQTGLSLDSGGIEWVVNAYLLAAAALFPLAGKLADVLGYKRMMLAGTAAFALGSLLCALAPQGALALAWLIVSRVVQGVGLALMFPSAIGILFTYTPQERRAKSMAVFFADDHPMVREGVKSMLLNHADLEVVGEASDGREAIEMARMTSPDLLLLDLRMPDMNGPQVTGAVLDFAPETKILILTTYDADTDILPAIEAGANGYLLKDVRPETLIEAIRDTAAGRTVLDSHAAQAVAGQLRQSSRERQELSAQELKVLRLAADGMTNRQIARSLFIGETTVKTYFNRIFAKLEVNDRTSAVARMMADHPDDMDY